MSTDSDLRFIPSFAIGDRLRKAREHTGLGHTVTNYERGHVSPRAIVLKMWALRTGVPLVWLETGEAPRPSDEGPRVVRHQGLEPRTR